MARTSSEYFAAAARHLEAADSLAGDMEYEIEFAQNIDLALANARMAEAIALGEIVNRLPVNTGRR